MEAHHVVTWSGRWYLVAWDLDRADWRTYRVDRVRRQQSTGRRFHPREVPGGDVRAFVSARFHGSDGSSTWPCEGEVLLALPAGEVQPYVEQGAVEAMGPDRCLLRAGAWSWVALAASLCRFGADIEVVEPPELREAFAVLAARAASAAA